MTTDECSKMELLMMADVDGELDIGSTAEVAAHLAGCPECRARQAELTRLSRRLRAELPMHTAPDRLRQRIAAAAGVGVPVRPGFVSIPALATRADQPGLRPPPAPRLTLAGRSAYWWSRFRPAIALPFGAGAALAAAIMFAAILPHSTDLADSVVASHIRALQPGHLLDVASTDQHNVKPWFDGRLDFAPPVKNLATEGFPLVGGRLDYLGGRAVAALDYKRRDHIIDLFVWPVGERGGVTPGSGERNGYNFIRWQQDQMVFWVVSDVNASELNAFVNLWRAAQ